MCARWSVPHLLPLQKLLEPHPSWVTQHHRPHGPRRGVPAPGEGSAGCQGCAQLGTAQMFGIKPIIGLFSSVSWGRGINSFLLMCFLRFLQGLASCFGICAINHLEETLAKLEDFVRSDVFKKSVGLFSIFKVREPKCPPGTACSEGDVQAASDAAPAGAVLWRGVNSLPRCARHGAGMPSAPPERAFGTGAAWLWLRALSSVLLQARVAGRLLACWVGSGGLQLGC